MTTTRTMGLSGNQLKLLALLLMTVDHIGMELFPYSMAWRIIGRLAMPIFAYMIAEGCSHTRNKGAYLLRLVAVAALCQIVYFFVMDSLYQCIFVTFSLSVGVTVLLDLAREKGGAAWLLPVAGITAVWYICEELPARIPGFDVDYGFWGVMLPVIICLGKTRQLRFVLAGAGLALLCARYGGIQWYAMGALLLLLLYNGQRGKRNIKWLFYLYYPAHLVALHFLALYLQ